jgi:hypothetical protein
MSEPPRHPVDTNEPKPEARERKRPRRNRNPARPRWRQNPDLWWNRNSQLPWCDNALDALLENWDQLVPPQPVKRGFRR